jgi:hypothetical protein
LLGLQGVHRVGRHDIVPTVKQLRLDLVVLIFAKDVLFEFDLLVDHQSEKKELDDSHLDAVDGELVAEVDEDQAADVGHQQWKHRGNQGEDGNEGKGLVEGLRIIKSSVEFLEVEEL